MAAVIKCAVLFAVVSLAGAALREDNIVLIQSGAVKGFNMTSRSGRSYMAFAKIPYAKPPVGPLRFKTADPDVKWDGILDADQNLPDCYHIPVYDPTSEKVASGTEDCLYLSVYTPQVGKGNKFPVMVYIHGGGWRSELPVMRTHSKTEYLLDEDIVLVTFHYRLGPLGFLSTEDEVLPGNLGLKDQVEVLRWIKKNIGAFGGNPDKITVFGNSAGGASSHYHLVSPLSKDLIQGGISQSGVGTCLWALSVPGVASARARMLARHLDCPQEPSQELVSCLRTKSAADITNAERIFISRDFDPAIVFQPVIESGPGAFINDSVYDLKVEKPWIVGLTSEDGAFKSASYVLNPSLMESFHEDGSRILPNALMFENATDNPREVASTILEKYEISKRSIEDMTKMWTDGYFTSGVAEALSVSQGQAYLYVFEYRAKTLSLDLQARALGVSIGDLGVSHTDELRSLLNFEDELPDSSFITDEDQQVSKRMVKIWTDFAKYGYPKAVKNWKLFGNEKNYLRIGREDIAEDNWWSSRVEFWANLPLVKRHRQH